jgi:hypothetical protein
MKWDVQQNPDIVATRRAGFGVLRAMQVGREGIVH